MAPTCRRPISSISRRRATAIRSRTRSSAPSPSYRPRRGSSSTGPDGSHNLYYASHTDLSYTSDILIADDTTADGVDIYAPDLSESSGQHDGLEVITGGSVRYAGDQFFEESDQAGGEADHDKWEEHFTDDFLNTEGDAERFLTNMVAARSNERVRLYILVRYAGRRGASDTGRHDDNHTDRLG